MDVGKAITNALRVQRRLDIMALWMSYPVQMFESYTERYGNEFLAGRIEE